MTGHHGISPNARMQGLQRQHRTSSTAGLISQRPSRMRPRCAPPETGTRDKGQGFVGNVRHLGLGQKTWPRANDGHAMQAMVIRFLHAWASPFNPNSDFRGGKGSMRGTMRWLSSPLGEGNTASTKQTSPRSALGVTVFRRRAFFSAPTTEGGVERAKSALSGHSVSLRAFCWVIECLAFFYSFKFAFYHFFSFGLSRVRFSLGLALVCTDTTSQAT